MNITELIVEFIQEGNVVEIPGIGTLTSTNVSAHHDAENGTYYPSRRTVTLSSSVSGNKAVVRRIAEKECVTNDIAEQMWCNFVGALDDKLQRNPAGHEFPGLGTLRRVNGKAAFDAVEGLDLDAGKKREQPIEHINTYTPKAEADPFAAFDKPAAKPAPAPAPAPAPVETPAAAPQPAFTAAPEIPQPGPLVQPVAEAKPAPEPAPESGHSHAEHVVIATAATTTAAELSELKKQLDSLPSSQLDAKAQRRLEKEKARAEKESRKTAEKAEKEARKAAEKAEKEARRAAKAAEKEKSGAQKQAASDELTIQKEIERDRKRAEKAAVHEANRAMKEAKRQAKLDKKNSNNTPENKRRKHRWLVAILILLFLALLVGGYYGYRAWRTYVPETKGTNNAEHIELPYYSRFSRDLAGLEYSEDQISYNREKVVAYMSDYIREFLNARHYNGAYAVLMDRVSQYADQRLHELMGEPQYAVQRFFPFDDYYREYCYEELQRVGGYVNRCRVQDELMDAERLDQFLDDLISELGLHPDGNRGMGGAVAGGNANANSKASANNAEYVEVVPSAPTLKASKQGFDIIAGFCTQKSAADKMTNQLKSLGCDAYIINRQGLYYVSMGSASSRTAAESLLAHIKSWYKGDVTIKNWNE